MNMMLSRPAIKTFKKPLHISEYPTGPCFEAGHLVTENASWRSERPVVRSEECIGCYYCHLCCSEGVIFNLNRNPKEFASIPDYLSKQGRFRHLKNEDVDQIIQERDKKWAMIRKNWRID